ncbi:DUF6624 domain-containing protein [uncultured Spirosoma sp.]|uniref:DUF6624 domain-containing protein n=1 Tax=uncultured Spirosoma sp. TaxID=278208 RepID=UPI0025869FB0|nr:DUF6624 domain-containing protein [uncultured Spirosoma sp.]
MLYPAIANELLERANHDLAVRQQLLDAGELSGGYNSDMEAVHLSNARWLQTIISQIGWPAQEQVGEAASQAAWLIVQHAISLPDFMKQALALMNAQKQTRTIDPVNLAFLSDRIAMYTDRPQSYGTQFVSDEQGRLVPYQLDGSLDQVNQRRRQLGLNTVAERMAQLTVEQNKTPTAADRRAERESYDAWRKRVGWITA